MSTVFKHEDFKCNENYVIKASAGTGKTYNIVKMVVRLLEDGTKLDQILIVTYTEKAAGELKSRIRDTVKSNAKLAHVTDSDVDNAMIGTIHAFCKKTIEEFCIASGKPSEMELIDEGEVGDLIKRYLRSEDVIEEVRDLKSRFMDEVVEEKISEKLKAVITKYYLDSDWKEVPEIVQMNQINPDEKNRFTQYLQGVSCEIIYPYLASDVQTLLTIGTSANKKIANTLIENGYDLSQVTIGGRMPSNVDLMLAIGRIKESKKEIETFAKIVYQVKMFVSSHIRRLYRLWQEEKAKHNAQTYNDMLRNVRERVLAADGDLKARLQGKYSYAIIDEFQDTNRIQWDIFKEVFLSDGHHITVVGDPKQSIYSFQGADITVFNLATKEIIDEGGNDCYLDTNFRSSKKVIDSTNKFFKNPTALPETMGYTDVECGKSQINFTYNGEEKEAYWIASGEGEGTIEPEKYADVVCRTIIDCCSYNEKVETKLRFYEESKADKDHWYWRNATFGDFAILARTGAEMSEITRGLEKYGIPFERYKEKGLFNGRECAHWVTVLEALMQPDFTGEHRSTFKKALFTDFFGYSLGEIHVIDDNAKIVSELEHLFEKWRRLAENRQWEELIDTILFDTKMDERFGKPDSCRTRNMYRQLGETCIDYLSGKNDLALLVRQLRRKQTSSGADGESDDGLVAKGTDFDAVKIMTIHASKGLEFPVVISVTGDKDYNNQISIFPAHDSNDQNRYKLYLDKGESNGAFENEREEEVQRLIYVSYTRAKYILMLPSYAEKSTKFIPNSIREYKAAGNPYEALPLNDEAKTLEAWKNDVREILKRHTSGRNISAPQDRENQSEAVTALSQDIKNHLTRKHAYSSLSHHKTAPDLIDDDTVKPDNGETTAEMEVSGFDTKGKPVNCNYDSSQEPMTLPIDFPAGTCLGNALHEVFEKADYQCNPSDASLDAFISKCFTRNELKEKAEWTESTKEMIRNVLSATLPEIHGAVITGTTFSLNEIGFTDRKNEMEFNFNKANEKLKNYFNGFMDLVFRRDEYYSVLDWKSDRLNDNFTSYSDAAALKEHVDELYAIQRVLYSYCLVLWLNSTYNEESPSDTFKAHFGGVYYVFLRGCNPDCGNGVYAHTWESFEDLESAYMDIIDKLVDRN